MVNVLTRIRLIVRHVVCEAAHKQSCFDTLAESCLQCGSAQVDYSTITSKTTNTNHRTAINKNT